MIGRARTGTLERLDNGPELTANALSDDERVRSPAFTPNPTRSAPPPPGVRQPRPAEPASRADQISPRRVHICCSILGAVLAPRITGRHGRRRADPAGVRYVSPRGALRSPSRSPHR